ncbi:membrane or secreted protein [Hufsiella ginkgonis]|uniref:Membrane or secreted protein n=1 Tax=Hufsiella ginkgonis TaxID=2695274 RepID=A0A7K1XTW7_9SPHI|nr:membrane or secreted protein [Hufsiella ginkgonis]MXV14390.1 membrane or secreted protein [Hufsiella ginkgonis]
MKTKFSTRLFITTVILLFSSLRMMAIDSKELVGAWGYGPPENRTVMIATDKIFSVANYDVPGKKLLATYGGTWRMEGDKLIVKIEWHSVKPEVAGNEYPYDTKIEGGKLKIPQTQEVYDRLDDGKPGALAGAWIITGNYANDKVSKRPAPFFPRRTMKVLSGKYFHWIAYNVESKQFMNAGGGTYTTVNGKYTENIEFFTKTAESVGKSLTFDYSFVDGDWRHKGEKSTGGPMDECWSKRETLEK